MIELLSFGFPISAIIVVLSFIIGVGISIFFIGVIGFFLVLGLSYIGVIRILPLLQKIQSIILIIWPSIEDIKNTIQRIYTVENKGGETPEKAIYMFHPHGSFSTSFFFHQMARLTEWPAMYGSCVITHHFWLVPFGNELLDALHAIPNRYNNMKEELEKGKSLSIIPGGVKEMSYVKDHCIIVHLSQRRRIFQLAVETGTPLVPVITYGENELYKPCSLKPIVFINSVLENWFGIQLCIPSWESVQRWIKMVSVGSGKPVHTVIGDPVPVEKETTPETLKENYLKALKKLYKETKPECYAPDLLVI